MTNEEKYINDYWINKDNQQKQIILAKTSTWEHWAMVKSGEITMRDMVEAKRKRVATAIGQKIICKVTLSGDK